MRLRYFLVFFLLLLVGCAKKECEFAADCPARECFAAKCADYRCEYSAAPGCCGNSICEASETKCNCSADCKPCAGSQGKYLKYGCNEQKECVLDSERLPASIVEDLQFEAFRLEATTTFEQPFDVDKSTFQIQFQLKSTSPSLSGPIKITSIQLLDKKFLLAKNTTVLTFNNISDVASEGLRMSYGVDSMESEKTVTLKADYEYGRKTLTGVVAESKTYEKTYATRIVFIDTKKVQ